MSYDPRPSARAYGAPGADDAGAKKGSVRAARERMQAAQMQTQLPDTSRIIGLPQRPNQLVSQYSTQDRSEQSERPASPETTSYAEMTSPLPPWPLPNDVGNIPSTSVVPPRSPERLQPPEQGIRPVSDDYPIQQPSPGYPPPMSPDYLRPPSSDYGVSYASDDLLFSPSSQQSSRPLTNSSAISEASSLGSIPDFPVPQIPASIQQARRTPSLGPPPSARRGPSSYYTQMSYVSPIAEESETRSNTIRSRHGSYASSNVFPTNTNDDFYPDDDLFSDDDETITSDRGTISPTEHDDRSGLVKQQPALVRQASLGRRTKPSLMTIKSVDSFGSKGNAGKKRPDAVGAGTGAIGAAAALVAARDGASQGSQSSSLSNAAGQMDASSSSSESVDTLQYLKSQNGNYADSKSPTHPLQQETRFTSLADRVGLRRPPKLDVDAVRDAEARGSLTSLPDLIRRATRLAANLDRGKTASRLGLDFWEAGGPDKRDIRQSGLSDMLAAFPPPGQDTPLRSGTPNVGNHGMSKWPSTGVESRMGMTDSGSSNEKSRKRRRCCGMPMWTFVTLLIVLLFFIAAAVIIPVVLIVLPNQNKSNSNAAQNTQGSSHTNMPQLPAPTAKPDTDKCDGIITCQNGGIAILNSDRTCNCVCINGFTGRTCTNNDATGCTSTSISGAANNATMGSGIPRLIESATNDFNIPLDATRILSIFSNLSLSCAAENALITFNGLASRSVSQYFQSVNLKNVLQPTRTFPNLHHPHPAPALHQPEKRQTVGDTPVSKDQNAPGSSITKSQPVSSNVTALDFARVGVLLALQESGGLDIAASAQEAIQNFLTKSRNGNSVGNTVNVNLFKLDLVNFTIEFKNGTTIRATPSSSKSSS
ncbi:uncharacterized protein K460DRAFT_379584 [Cucurbitaria berberidis CBS 394.84]|uniref:EGF-like domain-containing protein n=1 Tax=Cucurbitaria berberidis CBS 394.84 TaxID=1168544 RepID=A0A9P4GA59_9PLEO|nr:uncharacterized protein K460DRAFT_379584 [Cucurbitaria berberidis CBS 394.84]KAF1841510.1 hypothetical protein K460DRAFT_379584 [Cucurbitaria berberidis CBS 394.84]